MLVSTVGTAVLINLEFFFLFTPVVFYLRREVNVAGRKEIVINQSVNRTFTDHDRVFIVGTDMVDGLPLSDEGRDKLIQMGDLLFRIRDAGS